MCMVEMEWGIFVYLKTVEPKQQKYPKLWES